MAPGSRHEPYMFKALRELFSSNNGQADVGDGKVTLADVLDRG